ncbi:MAG TPA: TRIC cation channel family protein [Actinomycetes bacterium]|nr:TRIC cation channel family protein [Actinomycetes bacterium]
MFREGLFQFSTSFSLPWYAIAGAQAAEAAHLPVLGVLALAVIGPTAGRYYIDISSGVPPKQFIRGEWFVPIAALTGLVWVICDAAGLNTWWSAGISFVIGFTIRVIALYRGWEEPLAKEPAGVYQHTDGRPLLGRKIAGKSQRELRDLGLLAENPAPGTDG